MTGGAMSGPVPRFVRLSELETATPTETIIQPTLDDGDHDRFAHFARKADITKSAVTGRPIVALCEIGSASCRERV